MPRAPLKIHVSRVSHVSFENKFHRSHRFAPSGGELRFVFIREIDYVDFQFVFFFICGQHLYCYQNFLFPPTFSETRRRTFAPSTDFIEIIIFFSTPLNPCPLSLVPWLLSLVSWPLTLDSCLLTLVSWPLTLDPWLLTLDSWPLTLDPWLLTLDSWPLTPNP